ncbi:unnamed protein product [Mucor hiemalis]
MKNYLSTVILSKIKSSKKLKSDLEKLKSDFANKSRLPNGIMTNAANFAGLEPNTMRNFMENNASKLPINLWKDYVENNFDTIALELKRKNLSFASAQSSSSSAQSTSPSAQSSSASAQPSSSSAQPSSSSPSQRASSSAQSIPSTVDVEEFRTFSMSLNKALRKDLPLNIKKVVSDKLGSSLHGFSNFSSEILFIVNATSIAFKSTAFTETGGNFNMESASGANILQILPQVFVDENKLTPVMSSMPLPRTLPEEFNKDLENLFTSQHIQLMRSYFYGTPVKGNLAKHPFENYLFEEMANNGITKDTFDMAITSEEAHVVISQITTNIENMWRGNNIFQKLLDNLLNVLLRLHLAGGREREYRSYLDRKQKHLLASEKQKGPSSSEQSITSNRKREIIALEFKKKRKRESKLATIEEEDEKVKLRGQIYRNEERIRYFKALKRRQPEVVVDREKPDFDVNPVMKETSRSRLKGLKSIAKHILLFIDDIYTEEDVNKQLVDMTEKEKEVLSLLILFLKPYMPVKQNRYIIGHQLPFCILANDIFEVTGYKKFSRLLFPQPHPTQLIALKINATSLYQMLTSGPNRLSIADFNSEKIDSVDYSRSNKDAVFCSIFDLAHIKLTAESYGLKFAQYVTVLPGLKTCRILGSRKVKEGTNHITPESSVSRFSRILNNPMIIEESKKDSSNLRAEIISLQQEVNSVSNNLRDLLQADLVAKLSANIKEIKAQWTSENKDEVTDKLKVAKAEKYKAYAAIQTCRSKKSTLHQELYFKRMALRFKSQIVSKEKDESTSSSKGKDDEEGSFHELTQKTRGVYKANECRLTESPKEFVFSGTDNGIVNMSTTTAFNLKRYKFHLNLYNRYQLLRETDIDVEDNKEFLDLPPSQVRRKLERAKKNTVEGKKVLETENMLSKTPMNTKNASLSDFQAAFNLHANHSDQLRTFYSSKKRANLQRAEEIQKKKFLDSMVDKERRDMAPKKGWRKVVQFVGDRGTGVGTRIKGYRKYGGRWLENMRGQRGNVCLTDEYRTSQTCVYCFSQLEHPYFIEQKNGKLTKKSTKGSLMCVNLECVTAKYHRSVKSRDALSSLAIGLTGLSMCLLGKPIPHFSQNSISQYETEKFKLQASVLLNEEENS